MSKSVEIHHLSKSFGKREIFRNFSLEIEEGEFVAIIGPSGCGKSTLLNMIGLLEKLDEGTIKVGGKKLPGIEGKRATMIRRNKINYLFQSYALINDMTVMQNLLIAMNFINRSKKEKVRRTQMVLKQVGLLELKDEKINTLSGGEQQRVAIARTILKPGDIILADEPTGALDSETAETVFSLMMDLSKKYGKTVIMVTHNRELARRADRMIDLADTIDSKKVKIQ